MAFFIRAAFRSPDAAQRALEALLRVGFTPYDVAFRSRYARDAHQEKLARDDYDPIEGARLSTGQIAFSMSATGFNLVGNSTLANTTLGDIGPLLADVAEREFSAKQRDEVRIDALVKVNERFRADLAQDVLKEAGASNVRMQPVNDRA